MLQGSIVALVTPFNENGDVNFEKLGELLEYHINNKTDGIVILGTTGESSTLTFEEEEEIVKYCVKKVNKRVPLIVGSGSNETAKAVRQSKLYSSLGADYLLVITPYYNKTNEAGLIKHFELVAEASSCPIIMYNVPSRTGMGISENVVSILSKNPNIVGIKEASGNMSYAVKISKYLNDDFVMLSGNDDIIVPMMSIGAKGVISVLANICPKATHELTQYALNNDFAKASIMQTKMVDICNSLFYETNPIPVKAAMNYLGFNIGGYRMPLYDMSKDAFDKMVKVLDKDKNLIY